MAVAHELKAPPKAVATFDGGALGVATVTRAARTALRAAVTSCPGGTFKLNWMVMAACSKRVSFRMK